MKKEVCNTYWSLFLSFFVLSIFLSGCFSNCNEIRLTKSDKTWLDCYKNTKIIIFKSDQNRLDTFLLESKVDDYTTCSKFELGPNIYNYASIDFVNKSIPNESRRRLSVGLDKDHQKQSDECIKEFRVYDLYVNVDSIQSKSINYVMVTLPETKKQILTMQFKNGSRFASYNGTKIESLNWNKKLGLISYTTTKGETYYLLSRK